MIVVSKLINLWVAEGFIEGTKSKNLEEIAEEYLRDLVSRNLAMVIKRRFNGRVKTCCIHDLLRDSVRREAEKENFLYVVSDHVDVLPGEAYSNRRLILHSEMVAIAEQRPSVPFTYSFLCCIGAGLPPFTSQLRSIIGYLGFKLLRVLDLGSSMFFTFPLEIAQLVNLRYLTLNCYDELPSCISELCHLKILIISSHLEGLALPADSWNMAQLRHVRLTRGCTMPDPMVASALVDGKSSKVLLDLQTLSYISFDLMYWEASDINFPNLECLLLYNCKNLIEIPVGIGDIPTLELIELYGCGSSANDSAKRIQREQQQYMENDGLNMKIHNSHIINEAIETRDWLEGCNIIISLQIQFTNSCDVKVMPKTAKELLLNGVAEDLVTVQKGKLNNLLMLEPQVKFTKLRPLWKMQEAY
ncbi:putative late blight resistance protein homolog R1B-11 [Nicotiana tabacum]|uniref:Late blight resistance protein homolog R1B-11 n=1 Tax=Nicotiana tabacum TaxID=4097 RepID=A0AC58U373_TOBAC